VAVWSEPAVRENLTSIQNLRIDTPDGKQVALKDVATVSIAPRRTSSGTTRCPATWTSRPDVRGGSASAAVDRIGDKLESMPLPLGYHAEVSSALAERRAGDMRTIWYSLAALIAVYLLLQAAFRSWGGPRWSSPRCRSRWPAARSPR